MQVVDYKAITEERKMLVFSHSLRDILCRIVITFLSVLIIISSCRKQSHARKHSSTGSFYIIENAQRAKGHGAHRTISQTFYSMLTDARDVKVGERLTLF